MDPLEIAKTLTDPANKVLAPPAEKIGNTLASIWNITFGWIDHFDEKIKLKRQQDLKQFTKKLENEVSKIPLGDKIEPKLSIAGPTLEASKYFIEEEYLQNMFAKLLANSMNKNMSQYIQTSFVEIIKQMSPQDAQNLVDIFKNNISPICQIKNQKKDAHNSYNIIHDLIYWDSAKDESEWKKNAVSINNLVRLGLIELNMETYLTDENSYDYYINSRLYASLAKENTNIAINKGIIKTTAFGKSFAKICL
jgi:hypothetical protein